MNRLSESGANCRRLSDISEFELPSCASSDGPLYLEHGSDSSSVSSTGELSGIYFGILNIFTTLPQFLGTFISAIVFLILEPGENPNFSQKTDTDGPNAISVCLFIGAMSTLYAAHATRKLKHL